MYPRAIGLLATRNRHELAHQAAHAFLDQQYAGDKTLLIYDDSQTPFALCDELRQFDVVVKNIAPTRLPVKRNQMMRLAIERDPEAIYFVWDDDDYISPHRVRRQIEALLANPNADGCILCPYLTYDVTTREVAQLGKANITGLRLRVFADATLAFRRRLWERLPWDETRDPNACWRWMREPVDRIVDIPGDDDYIVIRHPTNHTVGMLPKTFHPQLRTLDVRLSADDVERRITARCTCPRRQGPPACGDPRTAR
jgi:hypothetical protein